MREKGGIGNASEAEAIGSESETYIRGQTIYLYPCIHTARVYTPVYMYKYIYIFMFIYVCMYVRVDRGVDGNRALDRVAD